MQDRRRLLRQAGALAALPLLPARAAEPFRRSRPGDADWSSPASWEALDRQVNGRLLRVAPPLAACELAPESPACQELRRQLGNPYFLGDEVGLTQSSGWLDAWRSAPSAYAVAARHARDVAAAVDFARENRLRLVVKGGGHSYQGTSNAPDSLLVWTRRMNDIALHEAFVAEGCGTATAQQAVSLGAGAIWIQAYDAVTTQAGRYVQGGGCATVGVAGLIQSGGFGSFSKRYGLAAAGLIEAEVVTADGQIRLANACSEPELFWALKGGGGGSLGVVTRMTLRTHALPDFFGAAFGTIRAHSDEAFRRLIARFVAFHAERLHNPHWGESVNIRHDNILAVSMIFQGLDRDGAAAVWRDFLGGIAAAPGDFAIAEPFQFLAAPARHLWDADYLRAHVPGAIMPDTRPGAPLGSVFWSGDSGQVGQFIHGYASTWLPEALLGEQDRLADALFAASRHWPVALHFNKGLAGAPAEAIAAARDTAIHPAALDAFALAIIGGAGPTAFLDALPDPAPGRRRAAAIRASSEALRRLVPSPASYVSESDFFEAEWQAAHWGPNYPRLLEAKRRYDPDGLFFVHHGVGSEGWSSDGFTRDS